MRGRLLPPSTRTGKSMTRWVVVLLTLLSPGSTAQLARRAHEVGGQRLAGCRGVSRRALPAYAGFQPPLPEPDRRLSPHPALQFVPATDRLRLACGYPRLTASHGFPGPPSARRTCPPLPWRPALWPAFPTADYYGDSVALRVAPFRQSRVPFMVDVVDGLGALFVSLRLLQAILLPWSAFCAR
jgi:hypothetical protein